MGRQVYGHGDGREAVGFPASSSIPALRDLRLLQLQRDDADAKTNVLFQPAGRDVGSKLVSILY